MLENTPLPPLKGGITERSGPKMAAFNTERLS